MPVDELGEAAVASFSALGCAGELQATPSQAARRPNNQQHHRSLHLFMTQYPSNCFGEARPHVKCFKVLF